MRRAAGLAAAALLLWLVLAIPEYPPAWTMRAFLRLPLELPVILLALVVLPARDGIARWACAVLAVILTLAAIMKLTDLASYTAFGRPFDPVIDLHLVDAAFNLLAGSIGRGPALLAVAACVLTAGALVRVLYLAGRSWARFDAPKAAALPLAALAGLLVLVGTLETASRKSAGAFVFDPPGEALTTRIAVQHLSGVQASRRSLAEFRRAASTDPYGQGGTVLDRLEGHDVLIVFIESYGRTSLDNQLYAATTRDTLRRAETRLGEAGLAMRSAWLGSPIAGGQSWLAHATLASGLAIEDQRRYAAMLASPRRTLWQLAAEAGYHTAAVVPAITRAWPEGGYLGFRTVLGSDALGYRGAPFDWVTMPDQYTLAAFRDRIETEGSPLFAQVVLISSHAPWTPIPPLLDWETLGNGEVFDRWADAGDPPERIWRDPDRVRDQYRRAVDYSLGAALSFAGRQAGGDPPLILVLGDHQPAGFVAQMEGRDVPVHLIGPPEIVARVAGWGWTPGLIPGGEAPVWPMEAFRDRFVAAFSSALARPGRGS